MQNVINGKYTINEQTNITISQILDISIRVTANIYPTIIIIIANNINASANNNLLLLS